MPLTTYTAGEVLTAASLNANFSFAAGGSGLTLITTATPSAVASVSINNCFTSTYDNYAILVVLTAGSLDNHDISMRLRASGTDATTNYGQLALQISASITRFADVLGTDEWLLGNYDKDFTGQYRVEISNPNKATFTNATITGTGNYNTDRTVWLSGSYQQSSTQFDGFTLLTSGTITGTIKVYGYQNS